MPPVKAELIERIPDEGQWFERGTRATFSRLPVLVIGAWTGGARIVRGIAVCAP